MLVPPRKRGCQRPLSIQQVVTAAIYLLLSALGLISLALCASPPAKGFTLAIYATLVCINTACWAYCSVVDVTVRGGIPCSCVRATQLQERYCPQSRAVIPGFDHFCAFLNVAVGARTYFFFYMLALFGSLQFAWHAVACSLVAAGPWGEEGAPTAATALAAAVALLALGPLIAFLSLFVFHSHLLQEGMGTVHWLLRRHEERLSREASARAEVAGAAEEPPPPPPSPPSSPLPPPSPPPPPALALREASEPGGAVGASGSDTPMTFYTAQSNSGSQPPPSLPPPPPQLLQPSTAEAANSVYGGGEELGPTQKGASSSTSGGPA